jgi:Sec-independent protein translocase protein TatA
MALESGKEMNDKSLVKFCLGDLVMLHVERNQMLEAKELYAELRLLTGEDYGSSAFMGNLVQLFVSEQDFLRAKQCLEKGWSRARNHTDSIALYLSSSKLSRALGETQKAYQELLRGVFMQNIETNKALQQPVLTAQRDYLSDKLEFEAYKFRMEKRLRMLYILLGSLLLVVVIYVLGRKLRMVKEKARKTIDELRHEMLQMDRESRMKVSSLLQELENKDKTASASIHTLRCELQKQADIYHQYIKEAEELQHCLEDRLQHKSVLMAEVFKNWFASMSKLLLVLLQDVRKEETKNKKLRKEVNLLHEKYYEGNKAFREVEKLVDRYHDDAMKHFRREMQWTEEADYRRVCYFFAGFSIQLIAVLMDEKEDSVYQKRHRLRKFLETSNLMHKDLFLLLLSK